MSTFLRVAGILVVVLVALAFFAMWGLSESGLDESKEKDAQQAGVSLDCYDAIGDSLRTATRARTQSTGGSPLEDVTYHEDIVRAAQDARLVSALCPADSQRRGGPGESGI